MKTALHALRKLILELQADTSLSELHRFRERIAALECLDAFPLRGELASPEPDSADTELHRDASALYQHLEATNAKFYKTIRDEILQGVIPDVLRPSALHSATGWVAPAAGESYDYLDDLVTGILQFGKPAAAIAHLPAEMVAYQPTPARHIFDLIVRTALKRQDVLVDLGSGLGHVALLGAICTSARCVGVEIDAAYVRCARQSGSELNLRNVVFLHQDAREADFSGGTVFHLYTPFRGTILRAVLDSLCREAESRPIRVCTFGPCTPIVAQEQWLQPLEPLEEGRIAIFQSRK